MFIPTKPELQLLWEVIERLEKRVEELEEVESIEDKTGVGAATPEWWKD